MEPPESSEEELLRRLRTCDTGEERRRLLERLLTPYLDRIARWALRIRGDTEEAAEVAQETLLAVCSHVDDFRGECRFSTWLYTIVRNQVWKRGARSARMPETPMEKSTEPPSRDPDPETAYWKRQSIEKLHKWIDHELTSMEAKIFLLHFGEEIPLRVLNHRFGLTNRSGARAYLMSAKRKLRRKLKSDRMLGFSNDIPEVSVYPRGSGKKNG